MKQRILIILLALLTTMTAMAQNSSGTFPSGVTWNLDTGTKTLTFTGSGIIPDNPNLYQFPWEKMNVDIWSLIVASRASAIRYSTIT